MDYFLEFLKTVVQWIYDNRNEIAIWVAIITLIVEYIFKPIRGIYRHFKPVIKPVELVQPIIQEPVKSFNLLLFAIPIPKNPFFTGRKEEFEQIQQFLLRTHVALTGLEGVGKSHTAAHFAYLHQKDYEAIFWVVADTQLNLNNNFGQLVQKLTNEPIMEQEQQIAFVQQWLIRHKNWLLILDNVEPEVDFGTVLCDEMCGRVLLTSRAQVVSDTVKSIPLTKMSIKESCQTILRQVYQQSRPTEVVNSEKEAVKILAKLLDGLPLALNQACAYIRQTGCGIAGYVQLMKKRGKVAPHKHPEPVATTWKLSYRSLANANKATIELLRICAFLDADKIPEEIFLQGIKSLAEDYQKLALWKKWRNRLLGKFNLNWTDEYKLIQLVSHNKIVLNTILECIQQYSLLQHDATQNMLSIHRLIQEDIRADLTLHQQKEYGLRAVRLLGAVFSYNENNFDTWSKPERLLASSLKLSEWINQLQLNILESGLLLNQLAYYLRNVKANYAQALPLYERSLVIDEKIYGKNHLEVATDLNNLALLYKTQGKYEQALPLYERSLAIREKVLGENHPDVATSLNNLALLYKTQSKYEQALPLYERSLAIREKVLGEHHPDVAQSLNNLALFYDNQGKYTQALPLYERSLAIFRSVFDEQHSSVQTVKSNYESCLSKTNK